MRSESGAEIPFVQTIYHRDPYELAYRFGAGLTGAAEGVTIEPVRQVRDMLVAGYAVGYNELGPKGREAIYPKMWSMTARAFDSGTSTERLMLQAVPFTSPFVIVHDGINAGIKGDYGSLAEMAGGVVGGVAIGKGVQKYGDYGLTMGGLEPAYGARGRQRGAVAPILLVTPEVGGVPSSGIRTALAATVGAESAATQALVRLNSETVERPTVGASSAGPATARVSSRPEWLQRLDDGNAFNAERSVLYPNNEVYINSPKGSGYTRLDSYNPTAGEIVSRKFTQLSEIQTQTGINYVNELVAKYPVNGTIANVPSSGALAGKPLLGQHYLEVPVQFRPIPQSVLDAADRAGVIIRDINGKVH